MVASTQIHKDRGQVDSRRRWEEAGRKSTVFWPGAFPYRMWGWDASLAQRYRGLGKGGDTVWKLCHMSLNFKLTDCSKGPYNPGKKEFPSISKCKSLWKTWSRWNCFFQTWAWLFQHLCHLPHTHTHTYAHTHTYTHTVNVHAVNCSNLTRLARTKFWKTSQEQRERNERTGYAGAMAGKKEKERSTWRITTSTAECCPWNRLFACSLLQASPGDKQGSYQWSLLEIQLAAQLHLYFSFFFPALLR